MTRDLRGRGPLREGERILVLGMARSGLGAVRLALAAGAIPTGLDLREPEGEREEIARLEASGARFVWGEHPPALLRDADRIVKSPGVRSEIPFLVEARRLGLPVWSEIELASRYAPGPILAITGTNGKSTTTAWAADMCARSGRAYELAGNIGRSFADAVLESRDGAIQVTEISSFQLEEAESFRPRGAALLNLTPDHLDRHGDLAAYREAKMRLFANQTPEDHAVLGPDDDLAREVHRRFRPRLLRFRRDDRGEEGTFIRDGRIGLRSDGGESLLCGAGELSLPGPHNQENALAALALVSPLDLPPDALVESMRRFPGLPHRLERIAEIDGVLFVNDSKATNVDSLATALEAFEAPLLLLAGGRDKGQDFRDIGTRVRSRCRRVYLFGESAERIRGQWGGDLCERHDDLPSALRAASADARRGEIVLLSPACASFDQFRNYEERGDRFRDLVRARRPKEI